MGPPARKLRDRYVGPGMSRVEPVGPGRAGYGPGMNRVGPGSRVGPTPMNVI